MSCEHIHDTERGSGAPAQAEGQCERAHRVGGRVGQSQRQQPVGAVEEHGRQDHQHHPDRGGRKSVVTI